MVISLAGALNGDCKFHLTMTDDDTDNLLDDLMLTLTDVVLDEEIWWPNKMTSVTSDGSINFDSSKIVGMDASV
jgi:hypothetical protein